jgi:hypothetical protein
VRHAAVFVFVSSSLSNILHRLVSIIRWSPEIHTDLTTGDLAMVAGWKLKGLPLFFFSGVAGVKVEV